MAEVIDPTTNSDSEFFKERLPKFAQEVLGLSQTDLKIAEHSNCINAAFNFSAPQARWVPYSPMEFLSQMQSRHSQLTPSESARWGDLVVVWTRTGGSWDMRSINVHEMRREDSDFPYGLVFDHVMVYLESAMVFHKPDPSPSSRYQIETLSAAVASKLQFQGFEITTHRLLESSLQCSVEKQFGK